MVRLNIFARGRPNMKTKFILITGGVLSSLGKGLAADGRDCKNRNQYSLFHRCAPWRLSESQQQQRAALAARLHWAEEKRVMCNAAYPEEPAMFTLVSITARACRHSEPARRALPAALVMAAFIPVRPPGAFLARMSVERNSPACRRALSSRFNVFWFKILLAPEGAFRRVQRVSCKRRTPPTA